MDDAVLPSVAAWDEAGEETKFSRTLTAVGDGACGKTSLLVRISRDLFREDGYRPTDFDTDVVDVYCGDKKIQMVLQDSAGQETYDRLRPIAYGEVDVILLCFSLDNPTSLTNVETTWIQELEHYCPDVPVILVGNKKDLRDVTNTHTHQNEASPLTRQGQGRMYGTLQGQGQRFVTSQEGKEAAKRMKAKLYVECSARDGTNCKKLLGACVRQATMHRPYNSQSDR